MKYENILPWTNTQELEKAADGSSSTENIDVAMPRPIGIDLDEEFELPEWKTGDKEIPTLCMSPKGAHMVGSVTGMRVLNGNLPVSYNSIKPIDCRFGYEYSGGTIEGAVNICKLEDVFRLLKECMVPGKKTCLIWFCEFTKHRSVTLVGHFKRLIETYVPRAVAKVDCYLLHRGFEKFFAEWHTRAPEMFTGSYVSMKDSKYAEEEKVGWRQFNDAVRFLSGVDFKSYGSVEALEAAVSCPNLCKSQTSPLLAARLRARTARSQPNLLQSREQDKHFGLLI